MIGRKTSANKAYYDTINTLIKTLLFRAKTQLKKRATFDDITKSPCVRMRSTCAHAQQVRDEDIRVKIIIFKCFFLVKYGQLPAIYWFHLIDKNFVFVIHVVSSVTFVVL